MTEENGKRIVAVMKGYERKSKLPHYNMWSKCGSSYKLKINELNYVTNECPKASQPDRLSLDAGCGFGVYSSMLLSKGYFVVSMDVSVGMLRKARDLVKNDKIFYVRGSVTHLPFKHDIFSLILCVDTLHHLTEKFIDMAFDEFRRTAKSRSTLITDTRNPLNLLLFAQYKMEDKKWAEKGGLTLKARSLKRMTRKLKKFGFKLKKTKGIGFPIEVFAPYIVIVSEPSS